MSRTIVICLALGLIWAATADASYRKKPSMHGTMIHYEICDSLVVLQLSQTASESDLSQLVIQRPELRDDYPSWTISESFSVVGLTEGTDVDSTLVQLRALPVVALANPVFISRAGALYYMTDVVMVSFKAETTPDEITQLNSTLPLSDAIPNPDGPLQWTVHVAPHSATDALEIANGYHESGLCRFAQPDFVSRGTMHAIPNDPLFGNQWHLRNTGQTGGKPDADIDADEAWDVALPSPSQVVRVAVVDMGFFYGIPFNHPDEQASWVVRGYDAVGLDYEHPAVDYDPTAGCRSFLPNCWHGTAVLGAIASATNNGVGIAGVMPGVPGLEYVAVKGWDNFGRTTDSLLAAAFRVLKNNPYRSDIITCAWEWPQYSDTLEQALYELHDAGAVVLFSSGNHFWIPYPAYSDYTFAVGATNDSDIVVDRNRGQDWVSGQGYELEVVAPGTWIWSWDLTGLDGWIPYAGECSGFYDYNCEFSGTSAAVAVAGGVAAMVRCRLDDRRIKYGKAARDSVMKVLRGSSEDQIGDEWDTPGWDVQYGYGRVNAYRALLSIIRGDVNNDGLINALDLSMLIDMVFFGGHATLDDRTGDCNCNGFVDSVDMGYLIDHVFFSGPPPGICFEY